MSIYEPNPDVQPTGAEVDEFVDTPMPRPTEAGETPSVVPGGAADPSDYLQGEPQTLLTVLARYESAGFTAQFIARAGGVVQCTTCHRESPARDVAVDAVHRLEGASDPADMMAVVPSECPHCGARGVLVVNYGPEAEIEDADVLRELPDASHGPRT